MRKRTWCSAPRDPRATLASGAILALMTAAIVVGVEVSSATAATVEYDLTVARETIQIADKPAHGMTINGTIPGPTLRFTEGDVARIRVHNKMPDATSIHWHGLLVPPGMGRRCAGPVLRSMITVRMGHGPERSRRSGIDRYAD